MTRTEEIRNLQARYREMEAAHKHVAASAVLVRLRDLMRRQIKAENRQDRKSAVA